MSNNNLYSQIEQNISNGLKDGLKTGDFSNLNNAIADSVQDVIKEATGTVSKTVTTAFRETSYNFNSRRPYETREETAAYAQKLREQRRAHDAAVRAGQNVRPPAYGNYSSARNGQHGANRQNVTRAGYAQNPQQTTALATVKNNYGIVSKFNPIGKNSSVACIATGATGMVLSGYGVMASGITNLIMHGSMVGTIFAGACFIGSAILLKVGIAQKGLLDRAIRYAQACGNNMYGQVSSLASATGVKAKKVKKDLKKILKKGFYPEGYIDDEMTTLMLSDSVYKQYVQTKNYSLHSMAQATANDLGAKEENIPDALKKLSAEQRAELKEMSEAGKKYINRLHELNAIIPGEIITNKLNISESILREIFNRLEEHPDQMDRMHKLMEYYLPTMIKLVEAYHEYDQVSSPGAEIKEAMEEIENTLDTINEAFTQLLNNLFQDSVWDVTTDAQVLKTMLKQEGLTD